MTDFSRHPERYRGIPSSAGPEPSRNKKRPGCPGRFDIQRLESASYSTSPFNGSSMTAFSLSVV
jgi:hypothetical protein